jgi:hypothetical protein
MLFIILISPPSSRRAHEPLDRKSTLPVGSPVTTSRRWYVFRRLIELRLMRLHLPPSSQGLLPMVAAPKCGTPSYAEPRPWRAICNCIMRASPASEAMGVCRKAVVRPHHAVRRQGFVSRFRGCRVSTGTHRSLPQPTLKEWSKLRVAKVNCGRRSQ